MSELEYNAENDHNVASKKSKLKAALLSGFVCPGLGQIYFKRYLSGTIFLTITLFGISSITYKIYSLTAAFITQLLDSVAKGNPDVNSFITLSNQIANDKSIFWYQMIGFVCMGIWAYSVIEIFIAKPPKQ